MAGQSDAVLGPREVFDLMKQRWLANSLDAMDSLLAEDAVIEVPFASLGTPRRFEGRDAFLAFADPERARLPVRFEECRETAIHDTADPEVIVVEYELAGIVTTTGRPASAPFIGVLRVRDGQIAAWREYQDKPPWPAPLASNPSDDVRSHLILVLAGVTERREWHSEAAVSPLVIPRALSPG